MRFGLILSKYFIVSFCKRHQALQGNSGFHLKRVPYGFIIRYQDDYLLLIGQLRLVWIDEFGLVKLNLGAVQKLRNADLSHF